MPDESAFTKGKQAAALPAGPSLKRYSSRRQHLDQAFLTARLANARGYDRIAGYFSSSLLELAGETLETVSGKIRVIRNSDLHPADVQTTKAAQSRLRNTSTMEGWRKDSEATALWLGPG